MEPQNTQKDAKKQRLICRLDVLVLLRDGFKDIADDFESGDPSEFSQRQIYTAGLNRGVARGLDMAIKEIEKQNAHLSGGTPSAPSDCSQGD